MSFQISHGSLIHFPGSELACCLKGLADADIPALKEAGVAEVFTPGTPTSDVVNFIKENVKL